MFLLSYIPVFPAFLKLRKIDPDTERPFKVPGSNGFLRVLAFVPMTLIIVALIFTAVPLSFDPETLAGVLPITIGAVIFLILGELIVNRKRDK
jgi:amino acid transporter